MKLLELVTNEYITIIDNLLISNDIENERIIIDREHFKKLLEKYKYMSFKEKTKVYKDLNLLIHDKNNYTMPCRIDGKTIRKVVLNYNTYITIKSLQKEVY